MQVGKGPFLPAALARHSSSSCIQSSRVLPKLKFQPSCVSLSPSIYIYIHLHGEMKNMKKEHFVLESKTQTEKRDNFGGEKKFGYKMHAASYCPIIQGFTLNTSFTIECGAVYIYAPTMCSARVTSCLASPCGASPPLQAEAVLVTVHSLL